MRELSQLELAAEGRLKYLGLENSEERKDEGCQSGLYGREALNLKGKSSGLDTVTNDCIVRHPQRCPHTHLKNEYAASNLKFRDLDLQLFAAGEAEIICTTLGIIEMMYNAGQFEWSAMLDFYATVLKAVEFGKKTWI